MIYNDRNFYIFNNVVEIWGIKWNNNWEFFFYMIIDKCKLKFNIGLLMYFRIKIGLFFFFYMVIVLYLY